MKPRWLPVARKEIKGKIKYTLKAFNNFKSNRQKYTK